MADSTDIQIVVGADKVATYSTVQKDLEKIAKQISNNSKVRPNVIVGLNEKATKGMLKNRLNNLVKNIKVDDIDFNLDKSISKNPIKVKTDTSEIESKISKLGKLLEKTVSRSVKNGVSHSIDNIQSFKNIAEIKKLNRLYVPDRSKRDPIENIKKQLMSQTNATKIDISGKNYFDGKNTEKLKSFCATVTQTTGEVKKLNFELIKVRDGKAYGFLESGKNSFKQPNINQQNGIQEALVKSAQNQLKRNAQYELALAKNTNKAIEDDYKRSTEELLRLKIARNTASQKYLKVSDDNSTQKQELYNQLKKADNDYQVKYNELNQKQLITDETKNKLLKKHIVHLQEISKIQAKQNDKLKADFSNFSSKGKYDNLLQSYRTQKQGLGDSGIKYQEQLKHLEDLYESINKLYDSNDNSDKWFNKNKKHINELIGKFKDVEKVLKGSLDIDTKAQIGNTKFQKVKNEILALQRTTESYIKTNDRLTQDKGLNNKFQTFIQKLNQVANSENATELQAKELRTEFDKLALSTQRAGLEGQTFASRLKSQVEKLGIYVSGAAVIMGTIRQIRQMVSTISELDRVVTDLSVATGENREETEKLLNTYSELGKELGSTTVEVGKASNDWLSKIGHIYRNIYKKSL